MKPFSCLSLACLTLLACSLPVNANNAASLKDAAQAHLANDPVVVVGEQGWLYLPAELRHLTVGDFWGDSAAAVSRATRPDAVDPLPAILDFKRQLGDAGVVLIVVPIPPKALIYPEGLGLAYPEDDVLPRWETSHETFYALLREHGVNVLDLTPLFLAERDRADGLLYCQQDTHWSGRATKLAADAIADAIATVGVELPETGTRYHVRERDVEIAGDLWTMLPDGVEKPEKETITLRFVGTGDADHPTPVEPNPSSPVVLLGDSHNLVFHSGGDMLAAGAGLPDQLAERLGRPVDLIAVRGSGATPARINLMRRSRSNPAYLEEKQVVVWVFTAREFTETQGWRQVPLTR
jgi:hypothetical protein